MPALTANNWPQRIDTCEDAAAWFRQLLYEGMNFHPDDPGSSAVCVATGVPALSATNALVYDVLMRQARAACEDVYEVALIELANYIAHKKSKVN